MSAPIRVVLAGLGPIGVAVGEALAPRKDVKIVAAADPAFKSQELKKLVRGAPKLAVDGTLAEALARGGADVVVLCTGSRLKSVVPEIDVAIAAGVSVISTCEELSALGGPGADAVIWSRLDARALDAGVTVLGTGVNPGFVMDRLVVQLAGACVRVDKVEVERVVDAAKRREPLRKKVGAGLSAEEFKKGVQAGTIGHVGLKQSAMLIAQGLGWKLGKYKEKIEPVGDTHGGCLGLRQTARAEVDGRERIVLRLEMSVGAAQPRDVIRLEGDPPLELRIVGGTHGDRGTVGAVVNAVAEVRTLRRGLINVVDAFC